MIPKIIHYCWIGNKPLPKLAKKCIASWKKIMPDYEIKLWNENNYDFQKNEFMRNAYVNKKWAFVSDYARFDIIYNYGGIYLDTDVEVLKTFDEFLKYPAFCGFDSNHFVSFGLGFGAEKGNKVIKEIMEQYETLSFDLDIQTINMLHGCNKKILKKWENDKMIPSPILQTQVLRQKYNLINNNTHQSLNGIEVFPCDYFCPKDNKGIPTINSNAYSTHWYMASWYSLSDKIKSKILILFKKIFGEKAVFFIKQKIKEIFFKTKYIK